MSLSLTVEKEDETTAACIYTFGGADEVAGRVRLHKSSGDVEILTLADNNDGTNPRFYLAHLVPHLHNYHDRDTYPEQDQWSV